MLDQSQAHQLFDYNYENGVLSKKDGTRALVI